MKSAPEPSSTNEPLTRDRVLLAAIALADTQGLDALTMRALGASLGVQAMSLYNHIKGKEDLLDGMVGLVVAEIEAPSPALPWRLAMERRAHSAHDVLMRHPWACGLLMSRVNVAPSMLSYINATLACLIQAGFSLPMADYAWNAMDSFIYGFTLQRLNFPFAPQDFAAAAASYLPSLSAAQYPAMHALTVQVAGGNHDGVQSLDFGLGLILDGLERLRGGPLSQGA
ncbi:TetR/AcrR family transcriptional regulator [Myxococcota bacterium]|nr:TetR/AcrR family transcriptional regulator [Myxococcota bacterium]